MSRCPNRPKIGFAAALLATLVLSSAHSGENRWTERCRGVVDGDTILVKRDYSLVEVDLAGIDAPEIGQPYGKEARDFTEQLLEGNIVTVIVESDDGSEIVGLVQLHGKDASLLIVQAGSAWYYPRVPKDQKLANAENRAKEQGRGFWQDPNPTPPWVWRVGNRELNSHR
jgi:endonuclease YncB( thermonuclease family)